MANNRVEVHIGAKTSELKKGMDDAEKIVSDSAKQIENSTKGVKFKFDLSNIKRQFDDVSKSISEGFSNQISEALGGSRIGSAFDGITSKLGASNFFTVGLLIAFHYKDSDFTVHSAFRMHSSYDQ